MTARSRPLIPLPGLPSRRRIRSVVKPAAAGETLHGPTSASHRLELIPIMHLKCAGMFQGQAESPAKPLAPPRFENFDGVRFLGGDTISWFPVPNVRGTRMRIFKSVGSAANCDADGHGESHFKSTRLSATLSRRKFREAIG